MRAHDLALMARNIYIGKENGKSLQVVEEVDLEPKEIEWVEYMQARIRLDITRPY